MKNIFGKMFAGAGLGFLFGGPLGALFGALVAGGLSDTHTGAAWDLEGDTERMVFTTHLVVLLTLVARSDARIAPVEARVIADFFKNQLNFVEDDLAVVRRIMKDTVRRNPSPIQVAAEFARLSTIEERLALLRLIWMVARADGPVTAPEERVIREISSGLGITSGEQRSTSSEFTREKEDPYATLGIARGASAADIKAAYRKMAKMYHPDRVAHLGADYARLATEKFARITEAYETIRRDRGF